MLRPAFALLLTGALAACSTSGNQERNLLGYGYEINQVSNLIYRIEVAAGPTHSIDDTRDVALLRASELALAKGYRRFQIVGGDGVRDVSGKLQAGPLPVPLPAAPKGSILVKLVADGAPADADTFDAEAERDRLRARIESGRPHHDEAMTIRQAAPMPR